MVRREVPSQIVGAAREALAVTSALIADFDLCASRVVGDDLT